MKKLAFLVLCFAFALTACRNDVNDVDVTETPYEPPILEWNQLNVPVNGGLTGIVVDENGEAIPNAKAKLGETTVTTDDYGHFFFEGVTMNAEGTYVSITKTGYFEGSRRFFPLEGEVNRIKIELITKNFNQTFESSQGGEILSNGGASIVFNEDAIKKEDGTAYNGTVNVAAFWMNPTETRTLDQMPGNLQGVNILAEEVVLGTYGMIAVELESESGESLNLKEGHTATLRMPVPTAMINDAPTEIPLWSFNEEFGIWVEEGEAVLTDGVYIGEVSHFSFWNCDAPFPLVNLTATVEDNAGNPFGNASVVISVSSANGPNTAYGYTNEDGTLSGKVPANELLILKILDPCGEEIYSDEIGPFPNDIDLGTITVGISLTIVNGELVNCDNDPVTNGVASFNFNGQSVIQYVTDGTFSAAIYPCGGTSSIEVFGIDIDALLESDPVSVGTGGTQTTGAISVCDQQLQNYIEMTLDGVTKLYTPAEITLSANETGISFNGPNNQDAIYMGFFGNTIGNYSDNHYLEYFFDSSGGWVFSGQGPIFDQFEVTEFGGLGEAIKGTFSGTLMDFSQQPPVDVIVTGEFSIIND